MSRASRPSALRDHARFLARFLRSPRTVGAIAPSSPALAREMVRGLDPDAAETVVELGPGFGPFTAAILPRLAPASRFLAIDVDREFVDRLHERWPALDVVCASAEDLQALAAARGLLPIDRIVSGLPFASLPGEVTRRILAAIEHTLGPSGTFTTFQYVHAYGLPPAVAFRRDITRRMGGPPTRRLVMKNAPPAWVLRWTKGA